MTVEIVLESFYVGGIATDKNYNPTHKKKKERKKEGLKANQFPKYRRQGRVNKQTNIQLWSQK